MKYEGVYFTNLTNQIDITWGFSKWGNEIHWSGEYWLINMAGHLIKYDGNTFINLGEEAGFKFIDVSIWNGKYWLIGGRGVDNSPKLVKYDGRKFIDLTFEFLIPAQSILEIPPSQVAPTPIQRQLAFIALGIIIALVVIAVVWKKKVK